jgi:membrane-associated HD superfamily phosphohydrolase
MRIIVGEIIEKMKKRWGVESFGGLLLILFIFAITGITTLYVRKLAFDWIGIGPTTPLWLELVAWILIVFPSYQLLFLLFGFVMGQFEFVWNFEKKSLNRIKNLFTSSK